MRNFKVWIIVAALLLLASYAGAGLIYSSFNYILAEDGGFILDETGQPIRFLLIGP